MANASYVNGVVTVSTTPTLVCTVAAETDGVLVQNTGSAAIFIGGPTVAASGASAGISVAANTLVTVPTSGTANHDLYAVVATATQTLAFLAPVF